MYEWQKLLISPGDPMSCAVKLLDSESMRIVLVADKNRHLLGTITDGDIRRGLIRHLDMNTPAKVIMNKSPKTGNINSSPDFLLSIMKQDDLLHVPLINDNGILAGLETLQHLTEQSCYDNPVFLMAGGFGKRLHPLTLDTPKPLLKVGNKPILQTILESFIEAGFHRFYISTHYKSEQVRSHFGTGDDWNVTIEYIHEKEPLGTAGALGLLPDNIPEKPLIMMNGDLLTKVNFEQLLRYHEESGGFATMCVREYDFQVPYGVIKASKHHITEIVEKPIHKFFVNAGIYVISPELYNSVSKNKYLDMPDLLQKEITSGKKVNMFPMHEYWLDIGQIDDFERAQEAIGCM